MSSGRKVGGCAGSGFAVLTWTATSSSPASSSACAARFLSQSAAAAPTSAIASRTAAPIRISFLRFPALIGTVTSGVATAAADIDDSFRASGERAPPRVHDAFVAFRNYRNGASGRSGDKRCVWVPVDGPPERSSGVEVDAADRDMALARRRDGLDFETAAPRLLAVGGRLLPGFAAPARMRRDAAAGQREAGIAQRAGEFGKSALDHVAGGCHVG